MATVFPFIRRFRIPLSRDQVMLLMVAVNELFLGIDTYTAHIISGTIRPNEWIPIIFGLVAGGILLLTGLIALKNRPLAAVLATLTLSASIGVGLLGTYFHWVRAILPTAPAGQQVSIDLLVWAPPMLAPLTFCLVGVLGISAAWIEDPPDSGVLALLGGRRWAMPFSKMRAYLMWVSLAILATVVSSVLDHARTHFENPWLWAPTVAGAFGTLVTAAVSFVQKPTRADLSAYVATMLGLILVGLVGFVLHVQTNLVGQNAIVVERFIRGAPFLAPLLFCNMGALGLIVLLDPNERSRPS
ncbi:MAG: hypothetical protein JW850_07740 [Thermoflexales bacterium]|nr:hypothetical protein [Thermoflexales bacterium]